MRRDVFQAIADPTRRTIIDMLAQKRSTLSEVADNFDMSLPAISKHMKILAECGLVIIEQEGRERYCEAKLEKLAEVSNWVNTYQTFWNERLSSLKTFMEKKHKKK
ncbi:MAG: winged helix-turn-helix transcriptional regulator [Niastella sp.]|nr:winged helix-turn-helix transcriptional regulator [Niastella sp.]